MDPLLERAALIASGTLLAFLTFLTCLGNLAVILAICSERVLRNAQNYLVLSLAVADLMVALLVMPLAALYQLQGQWTFGMFKDLKKTYFKTQTFIFIGFIKVVFCAMCGLGLIFFVALHQSCIFWLSLLIVTGP